MLELWWVVRTVVHFPAYVALREKFGNFKVSVKQTVHITAVRTDPRVLLQSPSLSICLVRITRLLSLSAVIGTAWRDATCDSLM